MRHVRAGSHLQKNDSRKTPPLTAYRQMHLLLSHKNMRCCLPRFRMKLYVSYICPAVAIASIPAFYFSADISSAAVAKVTSGCAQQIEARRHCYDNVFAAIAGSLLIYRFSSKRFFEMIHPFFRKPPTHVCHEIFAIFEPKSHRIISAKTLLRFLSTMGCKACGERTIRSIQALLDVDFPTIRCVKMDG